MRGIDAGYGRCESCGQLLRFPPPFRGARTALCPRCGSTVHLRRPASIQNTWALVLASIVFYIPANLLPMMHVHTFAGSSSDTIMSGIIYFLESGSYLIGIVIFIASIFVPTVKIFILIYLLLSIQRGWHHDPIRRQKLYLFTEIIGRWSMVDVFVVSIMIALVHFRGLSEIRTGLGALFFLLVVISTMLAAMTFDPRLIWDQIEFKASSRDLLKRDSASIQYDAPSKKDLHG
ncbi:paraquat-inducible protein A [Nitratifractor salsuginis]|uniref:Paraquat-inducible protein A n=1 Tax=Nitratifractor salsuginis (strain DSM 16511 / JCM 12458 / E9I37-1) TaxID=749222 RepID=E6X0T3_NITSE|nr:paraquat-inducible protein A [Nitratifractor salsuginis]ADV46865.1 Paraquat-inducible protein A [Nitratifractor salsuginis DSM 16511]